MTPRAIDFVSLTAALLQRADELVPQWLPGGGRKGHEWICAGFGGGPGRHGVGDGSLSVNLRTGAWADFSGDDKGRDLVSLYAAIHGTNNGQAAHELMEQMGMGRKEPPPNRLVAPSEQSAQRRVSVWRAIVPVPAFAPEPDFRHWHYQAPEATWEYRRDGERMGYVVRFRTSGGGKEILPYTWCQDHSDDRGTQRWHWKQWDDPRPLFLPAGTLPLGRTVVIVEGEKCAAAGHALLGAEFAFVTWPGGAKAWAKADWAWLHGRRVTLWPDCDAKRQALTRDEREAGVDPATRPLLPEQRQPGMACMRALGAHLRADQACDVRICAVPAPGDVADGWDIADAIAQGWDAQRVRSFLLAAQPIDAAAVPPDERASTPAPATAEDRGGRSAVPAWKLRLVENRDGVPKAVRENVVVALDGVPSDGIAGVPEVAGIIAWNEFTNDVCKLAPSPWGTPAGVWAEVDELLMGEWLMRVHRLPSMPRGTLEEAVRMVAHRHAFHPVRDYLRAQAWDRTPRLSTWLRRACLEEDEWDDREPLQRYLAAAGTYYIMGLCQRVLCPGCKFDYMLVLESPEQGRGKSTLFHVLGGQWFADTGLVLGDKDSYQQLQGRWVYEMGELDALSKIEITKVKQYIASQSDYFRASFDRRAREYPRQVCFGGTTNDDQYLIDSTGNRRFWPVRVTRNVDLEWLRANRDQLFAEAVHRLAAGKRYHPLPDEERELFAPQQEARRVVGPIEAAIVAYLYDENQRVSAAAENGALRNEITLGDLLKAIGYATDKQTDLVHKRAGQVMRRLGWEHKRSSASGRPWVYRRPPKSDDVMASASHPSAPQHDAAAQHAGSDSECPF